MKKLLALFLVFAGLIAAGCLQEKEITAGAVPTGTATPTETGITPTPTSSPTSAPTATTTATPTATPSATVTPAASSANCTVYTDGDATTFRTNAEVKFVVNFQNLPADAQYAVVKCDTNENPSSELIKKKPSGINVPKTCVYTFPANAIFTATAGGASCSKIVSILS
jgi:hypothetical protein